MSSTVCQSEIDRFSAQAQAWWDETGPFRALHELGPLRLSYIKEQTLKHLGRPLKGLRVLDVGCGGGLMAEALAREGALVTGLDASQTVLDVAKAHAAQSKLAIDYVAGNLETMATQTTPFDVVTALEVLEHVADIRAFSKALGQALRPGGLVIAATLNRTKRSFLLAIVAAEYILGWVPPGTHDWDKFVRPSELRALWAEAGIRAVDGEGVVYRPLVRAFERVQGRAGVNYFMTGTKEKEAANS